MTCLSQIVAFTDCMARRDCFVSPVLRWDPLKLLVQFLTDKNIRPVDLFRTFDKDKQFRVTREQFIQGLKVRSLPQPATLTYIHARALAYPELSVGRVGLARVGLDSLKIFDYFWWVGSSPGFRSSCFYECRIIHLC